MMLNEISDDAATQLTTFYQKLLTETQHPLSGYEAHFNIGLMAWRSGDVKSCRHQLQNAAECMVHHLQKIAQPKAGEQRSSASMAIPFLIVFNFGEQATINQLCAIDKNHFAFSEPHAFHVLADTLDLLRHYFSGQALHQIALNRLLTESKADDTDPFYRSCLTTLLHGLLAVLERNDVMVEKCVQHLLQLHEYLAREGGWQRLAEGVLALWAMTLVNIAKREGLTLQIDSPYLFPR